MAASILSNQATGAGLGVAGVAREDLWLGQTVQFSDAGVGGISWAWEFVFGPPGYVNTFSDPTISNPTWLPDVPGSYLVELTQNPGEPDETVQRRVFRVRKTAAGVEDDVSVNYGLCLPAPEECDLQGAQEANYSGNTRGWDATWIPIFETVVDHETTLRGLSTTTSDLAADVAAIEAQLATKDWKDSVDIATTGPVLLTGGVQVVDGASLGGVTAYSVLVKDQAAGEENGIYDAPAGGGAWTRRSDADTSAKVTSGMAVRVEGGTDNVGTAWYLSTPDPIVLGTTALTFAEAGGSIDNPWLTVDQVIQDSGLTGFSVEAASLLDLSSSGGDAMLRAPAGSAFVGGLTVDQFSDTYLVAEATTELEFYAGTTALVDAVTSVRINAGAASWLFDQNVSYARIRFYDASGVHAMDFDAHSTVVVATVAATFGMVTGAATGFTAGSTFAINSAAETTLKSSSLKVQIGAAVDHHVFAEKWLTINAATGATRIGAYNAGAGADGTYTAMYFAGVVPGPSNYSVFGSSVITSLNGPTAIGQVRLCNDGKDAFGVSSSTGVSTTFDFYDANAVAIGLSVVVDTAGYAAVTSACTTGFTINAAGLIGLTAVGAMQLNAASLDARYTGTAQVQAAQFDVAIGDLTVSHRFEDRWATFDVAGTPVRIGTYDTGASAYAAIYFNQVTPGALNYGFLGNTTDTYVNAPSRGGIMGIGAGGYSSLTAVADGTATTFSFRDNYADATGLTLAVDSAAANIFTMGGLSSGTALVGTTPTTDRQAGQLSFIAPDATTFVGTVFKTGGSLAFKTGRGQVPGTDESGPIYFGLGDNDGTSSITQGVIFGYGLEQGTRGAADWKPFTTEFLRIRTTSGQAQLYSSYMQVEATGNMQVRGQNGLYLYGGAAGVTMTAVAGPVSITGTSSYFIGSTFAMVQGSGASGTIYLRSAERSIHVQSADEVVRYRFHFPADVSTSSATTTNLHTLTLAAAARETTVRVRMKSRRAGLPAMYSILTIHLENPTGAGVSKIGETIDTAGDTALVTHQVTISGSSIIFQVVTPSAAVMSHSVTILEIS